MIFSALSPFITPLQNMSGRTLRKLPLRTHAMYLQRPTVTLEEYLSALEEAVKNYSQLLI